MLKSVVLVLIALTVVQPASTRTRLDAYEAAVAKTGRPDPEALAAIAGDVIVTARRSPKFLVWSEACASTEVSDNERCAERLRGILARSSETKAMRAEAASALMARGDKAAAATLSDALKTATPSALAPLAPILAEMPAPSAVPLLIRLVESSSTADQAVACRYLGGFDEPEVREALKKVVARNPPGTDAWVHCMLARARLREPDTRGAAWGYGHTLQGDGQIDAGQVLLELGDDTGVQLLTDLTHRGPMKSRLRAATLLVDRAPDVAVPVIEASEIAAEPDLRADALSAEKQLKRDPPKIVRALLADTAEVVQVRAADAVLAWAARARNR
jgi:hypothetical protein